MPPALDDFFHAKNPRDRLILSTDIYNQRILQSDSTRARTGHTQPKVVV